MRDMWILCTITQSGHNLGFDQGVALLPGNRQYRTLIGFAIFGYQGSCVESISRHRIGCIDFVGSTNTPNDQYNNANCDGHGYIANPGSIRGCGRLSS